MKKVKIFRYLIFLVILIIAGCPNTMIGLGDKVDIDAPSVSIGKYGDGTTIVNGDYVKGVVILTGSASDDIGIQSVKLSFDGGLTFSNATVSSNQLSWSYTVDTSAYADGEKDIIVLVSDTSASPKTSEERLLLYFDNTAPVLVVNEPAGYVSTNFTDLIINLKGEATDPYRIRKIDVELTGGSGILGPVEGTNSWTCAFTSTGTGNYSFRVIAEDYAGNRSTHFYHYDDVLVANDTTFITPEDVYKVENGEDGPNLTGAELAAIELSDLPISISMDQDNPVITISNPDPEAAIIDNVLPGNTKFIGSATDDDGINTTTSPMQISIDSGAWDNLTVSGSGHFVTWEYDKSFGSSSDHSMRIKAEDIYGVETISNPVNFRIDVDAAIIDITSPVMSEYKNSSDFSITGNVSSAGGDITHIDISLDNGSTWSSVSPSPALPATPVAWTYNAIGVSDGIIAIKARASDDDGSTWSYTNLQITVDTQDPVTGVTTPTFSSYVNGDVEIRGTSSDNNLLDTVEIKIGDDPARLWMVIADTDKYNWLETINSLSYENSTDGIETAPGSGIFRLNVYTRATDVAGNVYETTSGDHYFYIDNALDSPMVTMVSPQADVSLGGSLIVSGTAADDDGAVQAVYMQIDVNTAPGGTPNFSDIVTLSSPIDFDGPGGNAGITNIDESQFYPVSGTSLWSVEINTAGELYDTDSAGPHTGDIHIRVKSKDINGLMGDYVELHFAFDDSIPLISNLLPTSDAYVNSVFSITGDVHDETQIKHLEISYDGGTTYHYIIQNNDIQAPYGSGSVTTDYPLNVSVDTSNIPDVGAVTSSDITIRFKVTDNTNYQSQESLTYYVDNSLPSGWMSQDTTDIYGSGDNAIFSGYADDTGVVSGVDKIDAYFEKDGFFYDPRTGSSIPVTTQDINGTPVPFTLDTDYKVVIDSTIETLSGANPDSDGIAEELNVGTYYEWKFQIDSSNIPDGISTLHYVVYDKSGNMFHNTKSVFIKNDKPLINNMQVGYDLDSSGSVQGDEIFTYAGQFKARGRIYFEFNASDVGGIVSYQVYEGTDATGTNVLSVLSGEVDISGESDGVVSYFCQVTDSDGITDETIVNIQIDNIDDTPPVFTLDSLSQGSIIDGHLEETGVTLYGIDPDVSGTIKFTGTASDDQGMKEIRLTLDGTLYTLANWSGGLFESRDGNFTIDTQTIDPNTGHEITWTYIWDTSTVSGVAAEDVSANFIVDDFGLGPNQDTGSITVDVVPYITEIARDTARFSTNRSRLGKYQIQQNETLVNINGFNLLSTGTNNAYISNSTTGAPTGADSDDLVIDPGSTVINLVVDLSAVTHSGWIRVFANGIEAINNIDDNSEASNIEGSSWTDDRYVNVWQVGDSFNGSDSPKHPSMSLDTSTDILYGSWSNYAASSAYYGTVSSNTEIFSTYDPPEYSDIIVYNGDIHTVILENYYNGGITWGYLASRINNGSRIGIERLGDDSSGTPDHTDGRDEVLYQFQNPRISLTGTNTKYVSYYDAYSKCLKYSIVTGGTGTFISNNHRTDEQTVVDGVDDFDNTPTDGDDVGQWSSIQVDPDDGYPVILYSDTTNRTMKIARGLSTQPVGIAGWSIQNVLSSDSFSGNYVTMVMDSLGDIHAIYYKTSTGDLQYIHASDVDGGATYIFDSPVTIDSEGAVGSWCDITFLNGKPVVSYLNSSMVGTFSGMKYAIYEGDGSSWIDSSDWEYGIVPADSVVGDGRSNIEASTTASWGSIAIGFGSGTFDLVYLKSEE